MLYLKIFPTIIEHKLSDAIIDSSIYPRLEEILKLDSEKPIDIAIKILDMLDDIAYFSLTNGSFIVLFDSCLEDITCQFDDGQLSEYNKKVEVMRTAKNR